MSKEPTSKGRLETGNEANARRRRRRRGGGLRVPSDKVPRAASERDGELDETPEPPEPEAPELAVSVASAFGADGDGEEATPETAAADREANDLASPDGAPLEGATDEEADEAAPEKAIDEDVEEDAAAAADADGHDAAVDDAAEEDAAGAQVDEQPEVEAAGADDAIAEETAAAAPRVPLPEVEVYEEDGEELPDEESSPGAAVDDAGEGEAPPDGGEATTVAADAAAAAADFDGAESVDIPIDEDSAGHRRMPRAQTEALTEEDLEELMEPIEDDDDVDAAAAAPGTASAPEADDEVDFDAQETAQFVPVVIEEADEGDDAVAEAVAEPSEPTTPTPVTILERQPMGGAGVERDAGDSGELLSDELIEEIEESGASGAAAPAGDAVSADPAAPAEPAQARENQEGEDAARTPDPPPVPGGSSAPKPPPAPSASPSASSGFAQAAKGRAPGQGKAWFEEIFDEDYLRTLPFLTPQATQAEAKFVVDAIAASPGAQLLDVGCGYGRHAMELAARGFHVVGLDSSLPLLLRGADEAQRRGLTINFVHGDMRELTFDSQFDAAYCLFSTFGYFDDETNKKTAQNISRALKPGARFVVEVLNRDYLIQDLPTRVWWEGDGCVVLEEVDFNYFSSRIISNRSVVFDDGRQLEQEISIRAYSLHELGKLLHAAGFRVLEVSGSMNTRGRFFGAKARDIIVVAEKRGSP